MKEPSERDIKKEKQSELDKIAQTNAKCVAGYQVIRNTVFNNISDGDLTKMNKYIKAEYGKVYTGLKGMIIDALNDAKDKNVKLVEKLLDESLPPAKHYEVLPKTSAFKYTNRVFTEKSVSVRSQKAADTITQIIADGRNDGLAIKDIQKKVDIVMGFRDSQGRLTDKSKKLIESGKFSHRNGSIYETYRIARTEVMRMNAFAKYDQFDELRQRYPNARLKLLATLDDRTREQSREMNGQISNAKGEFLYPDSKYYRLGTAPAQWCINDRETCTIVFLTNKEAKENREELREEKQEFEEIAENYEQFETGEQANNFFYNNSDYKKWLENLTKDEKDVIAQYTDFSDDINQYLRKIGDWEYIDKEMVTGQIKELDNAIKNFELQKPIQVIRTTGTEPFGDKLNNLKTIIGEEITDKAFMSTSLIEKGTKQERAVKLFLNVPKGKSRGAYINEVSTFNNEEYEFLLKRNTTYKITSAKIENDIYVLEADILP